jgi:protein tyrosine phosphatase (PTP) superfamily phosphohydrolase (DUF442 family)
VKFDLRTFNTVLGYGLTRIEKLAGFSLRDSQLEAIYNYLPISTQLATSGQPTTNQFSAIKHAGYSIIINLAPANAENALRNEAAVIASLGMDYINIPINFSNTSQQGFEKFISLLQRHSHQKIWVHCAANMRVSCFIFKYRTAILGTNPNHAQADLRKIWQPNAVWKRFIAKPVSH